MKSIIIGKIILVCCTCLIDMYKFDFSSLEICLKWIVEYGLGNRSQPNCHIDYFAKQCKGKIFVHQLANNHAYLTLVRHHMCVCEVIMAIPAAIHFWKDNWKIMRVFWINIHLNPGLFRVPILYIGRGLWALSASYSCLLPWIGEFIHAWCCSTPSGVRSHRVLRCGVCMNPCVCVSNKETTNHTLNGYMFATLLWCCVAWTPTAYEYSICCVR